MRDFRSADREMKSEAAECDLVAKLVIDQEKRAAFERMAPQYRKMINHVRSDMSKQK